MTEFHGPEQPQAGRVDFSNRGPLRPGLSPETLLKGAIFDAWRREGTNLLRLLATRILCVIESDPAWQRIADSPAHADRYRALVQSAAELGNRVLSVDDRLRSREEWSPDEKEQFYSDTIQPLANDFARVLQSCRNVLPGMMEQVASEALKDQSAVLPGLSGFVAGKVDQVGGDTLREVLDMESRVRAMALVTEKPEGEFDLREVAIVATQATPVASFRTTKDGPARVVVCGPMHRAEAVLRAFSAEIHRVVTDFRGSMERNVERCSVLDLGTRAEDGSDTAHVLSLLQQGNLMHVEVAPAGTFQLSIPVVHDDFGSLAWLRDRALLVVNAYQPLLESIGARVKTGVRESPVQQGCREFFFSVEFPLSEDQSGDKVSIKFEPSVELRLRGMQERHLFSSLRRALASGGGYRIAVTPDALVDGRLELEPEHMQTVDSIAAHVSRFDALQIEGQDSGGFLTINLTRLGSDEPEVEADDGDSAFNGGLDGSADSMNQKPKLLFQFLGYSVAIEQARMISASQMRHVQRQLNAVGRYGLGRAGSGVESKSAAPLAPRLVIRESLVKDRKLVNLLLSVLSSYDIGTFDIDVDNDDASEYLAAVHEAAERFSNSYSGLGRLVLQLRTPGIKLGSEGVGRFVEGGLQILDLQGRILAEGSYSATEKLFKMICVPEWIVKPLSKAVGATIQGLIEQKDVLRVLDLGIGLRRRRFIIPDELLVAIREKFKGLAGREMPEDLNFQVESFVRLVLSQLPLRLPVRDSTGTLNIYTNDDLPPSQRR